MKYIRRPVYGGLFSVSIQEERSGQIIAKIKGKGVKKFFQNEIGGHRWQRVSPTEKRGRVHTSTITIAILDDVKMPEVELNMDEVEVSYCRGTGAGGQHKNKKDTCCKIKHIPTGTMVKIDGRSQSSNYETAIKKLKEILMDKQASETNKSDSKIRKNMVGSGMRGDKRRTYREKDDKVVDHITGKRASLKKILKGEIELLH